MSKCTYCNSDKDPLQLCGCAEAVCEYVSQRTNMTFVVDAMRTMINENKALKAEVDALKAKNKEEAPFGVSVGKMVESHRVTYLVNLVNKKLRPANATILDPDGVMTPMQTEKFEDAQFEAGEWAEFLGTEVDMHPEVRQAKSGPSH